jgi:hypothetical protein
MAPCYDFRIPVSRPDLIQHLSPRLAAFARRVREAWGAFKAFGDALGYAGLLGLIAAEKLYGLMRNCAPWMLLAALAGAISPATGGLGVPWLERPLLATWAPVGILPIVVVAVRVIAFSLAALREETARKERRRQRERRRPDLYRVLIKGKRERLELNSPLELEVGLPHLDDFAVTYDIIAEDTRLIRTRYGIPDAGMALMGERDGKGFQPNIAKGIDDRVKDALDLGGIERSEVDEALSERLRPLQYRHAAVEFDAGPTRYLLVVLSGATISDDVHAEINETATLLVEEYVWAVRKPERRRRADGASGE